jgi:hypothetical protein
MARPRKQTLVDFINTLNTNADWQRKFAERGKTQEWAALVNAQLSPADAQVVLSEDKARLDQALGAKAGRSIVWEGTTVWA